MTGIEVLHSKMQKAPFTIKLCLSNDTTNPLSNTIHHQDICLRQSPFAIFLSLNHLSCNDLCNPTPSPTTTARPKALSAQTLAPSSSSAKCRSMAWLNEVVASHSISSLGYCSNICSDLDQYGRRYRESEQYGWV